MTPLEKCFVSVAVKEHIILMPWFIGNIKKGVYERLNKKVMEYCPNLEGTLVSYTDVSILQNTGGIHEDSPHVHFDIKYTACVFHPPLGAVLNGVVNKVGEDYFTCVVCGCFTVLVVLENGKYDSSVLSDIEEDRSILVRITKLPSGSNQEHVTLNGELYLTEHSSKKKKKGMKRNREHVAENQTKDYVNLNDTISNKEHKKLVKKKAKRKKVKDL